MPSPRTTALAVAGLTVCGLAAYVVYFDYKRRNDSAFRKQLRKQKKRVEKSMAESREALEAASNVSEEELVTALRLVQAEPQPGPEAREDYFMRQVATGEQLAAQGGHNLESALAFYRALAMYPSPPELLAIYQKTVPEDILKLILRLINIDVSGPAPDVGIDDDETSSAKGGPPSETSSHEWDKVADPRSQTPPA